MNDDDQIIDIPGVGPVAFPRTMSEDAVSAAAHRLYVGATQPHPNDPTQLPTRPARAEDYIPAGTARGPGEYASQMVGAARDYATELGGAVVDRFRNYDYQAALENARTRPIGQAVPALTQAMVDTPVNVIKAINTNDPVEAGRRIVDAAALIPGVIGLKRGAVAVGPDVAAGARAVGRGAAAVATHPVTRTAAQLALDVAPGGAARAARRSADVIREFEAAMAKANAPPAVSPNAGGRLVSRSTPSVQQTLIEGLEATRAPVPGILAPSHPPGGGFTTPPVPSPNVGGRLVPGSTPAGPSMQQIVVRTVPSPLTPAGAPGMRPGPGAGPPAARIAQPAPGIVAPAPVTPPPAAPAAGPRGSRSKTAKHSENDLKVYANAIKTGLSEEEAVVEMLRQREIRAAETYAKHKQIAEARRKAAGP